MSNSSFPSLAAENTLSSDMSLWGPASSTTTTVNPSKDSTTIPLMGSDLGSFIGNSQHNHDLSARSFMSSPSSISSTSRPPLTRPPVTASVTIGDLYSANSGPKHYSSGFPSNVIDSSINLAAAYHTGLSDHLNHSTQPDGSLKYSSLSADLQHSSAQFSHDITNPLVEHHHYPPGTHHEKPHQKRKRANSDQLRILQQEFEKNQNPPTSVRKQISEAIGMPERSIQIWFQNQRAKTKKKKILKLSNMNGNGDLSNSMTSSAYGRKNSQSSAGYDDDLEFGHLKRVSSLQNSSSQAFSDLGYQDPFSYPLSRSPSANIAPPFSRNRNSISSIKPLRSSRSNSRISPITNSNVYSALPLGDPIQLYQQNYYPASIPMRPSISDNASSMNSERAYGGYNSQILTTSPFSLEMQLELKNNHPKQLESPLLSTGSVQASHGFTRSPSITSYPSSATSNSFNGILPAPNLQSLRRPQFSSYLDNLASYSSAQKSNQINLPGYNGSVESMQTMKSSNLIPVGINSLCIGSWRRIRSPETKVLTTVSSNVLEDPTEILKLMTTNNLVMLVSLYDSTIVYLFKVEDSNNSNKSPNISDVSNKIINDETSSSYTDQMIFKISYLFDHVSSVNVKSSIPTDGLMTGEETIADLNITLNQPPSFHIHYPASSQHDEENLGLVGGNQFWSHADDFSEGRQASAAFEQINGGSGASHVISGTNLSNLQLISSEITNYRLKQRSQA